MFRLITVATILALSTTAQAETPSYNYGTLGWQTVSLDDGALDVDGDGFGIGGSFEVGDNWHIVGGYSSIGFDFGIDLNTLSVGGGYHTAISDTTSFYANLLWLNSEADAGGGLSFDDDGFGIGIGLRSNITDRVELEGGLSHVDYGDGNGTALSAAGWYKFTDAFSLGVTLAAEEDVLGFGVGGRFYF
jgi:hypothetical protein